MTTTCHFCRQAFEQRAPEYRICLTCHVVLYLKTFPSNMMTKARNERKRIAVKVMAAGGGR